MYILTPFPKAIKGVDSLAEVRNLHSRQMITFSGRMDVLESELASFAKKGYQIHIVCSSKERIDNLKEFADRIGL